MQKDGAVEWREGNNSEYNVREIQDQGIQVTHLGGFYEQPMESLWYHKPASTV